MSDPLFEERVCRVCGCTNDAACVAADGVPCHWVEWDLCSLCERAVDDTLTPAVPCQACRAPMYWAVTLGGKRIPIDPEPVVGGNIRLEQTEAGPVAIYDKGGDGPHYISHFATCIYAAQFRSAPKGRTS